MTVKNIGCHASHLSVSRYIGDYHGDIIQHIMIRQYTVNMPTFTILYKCLSCNSSIAVEIVMAFLCENGDMLKCYKFKIKLMIWYIQTISNVTFHYFLMILTMYTDRLSFFYWKWNVTLTTFLSLATLEVVKMTIPSAASEADLIKMIF